MADPTTEDVTALGEEFVERFWSRVDKTGPCWLWQGRTTDGYGRFSLGSRRQVRAHRLAYSLLVGPIPDGAILLHSCDVRRCVNPDHLRPGTNAENVVDRDSRGRGCGASITHCKHGHEFSEENTRISPEGRRKCRACDRERSRRIYWAKRADQVERGESQ